MDVQKFVTGLTATYDANTAPTLQYWSAEEGKLEILYYMHDMYDPEAKTPEEENITGWGTVEYEAVHWMMKPGDACWLKVKSGNPTITCSGQVVALSETPITINPEWQLIGNPYPVAFQLNRSGMDCTGVTATYDANTAPTLQYWSAEGEKLEILYYMHDMYDAEAPTPEEENITGWGTLEYEAVNRVFNPCEGFWIKTKSGTGTIKFTR